MPTYEYHCTDCGSKFEVRASMKEKEKGLKPVCPTCGSKTALAVPSTVAIGSGGRASSAGCCGGTGCCPPPRR